MHNAEEVDGFFAALICSPEIAKPNEYLAEIWGEMVDDEVFADEQELQDFLSLLMRHWNSIGRKLEEDDVFTPLLFEEETGTAHGNDWARGFMRGVHLHRVHPRPQDKVNKALARLEAEYENKTPSLSERHRYPRTRNA